MFSVLFALLINALFNAYQTHQKKQEALQHIAQELERNIKTLEDWHAQHSALAQRLHAVNEGKDDSLKQALNAYPNLNLSLITNDQNLLSDILSATAWESAKASGIVAEFDFTTNENLTRAYSLQEVLVKGSIPKFIDFYLNASTHDLSQLDLTLIQFELHFQEIVGQEYLLKEFSKKLMQEGF